MHIPEDHEYRFRIANDVASTLFVMAGAGTGKTTALVARIVSLVEAGVPMESIAAITFTRRAANELGVRIRNELERRSRHSTDEASALCTAAIAQLPGASIGTIHGFAQTLLEGWGGIIGLPMVFRVLDTVASEVRLQRSWSAFVESAMASEEVRRLFGWLADLNGDPKVLNALVRAIDGAAGTRAGSLAFPDQDLPAEGEVLSEALALADRIAPLPSVEGYQELLASGDPLAGRLMELDEMSGVLRQLAERGEVGGTLAQLAEASGKMKVSRLSRRDDWLRAGCDIKLVRDDVELARQDIELLFKRLHHSVAASAARFAADFVTAARTQRIAAGELNFDDLLWGAVELLETAGASALEEIRGRFRVVLVDEFQDTDPQQVRLVRALTGVGTQPDSLDGGVAPLFFVGDPRQSIYRFRGADVNTYLEVAEAMPQEKRVPLVVNFRSRREITSWVNETFGGLLGRERAIGSTALVAHREPDLDGPSVRLVLPSGPIAPDTSEKRMRAEAALSALSIEEVITGGYQVEDGDGVRPARYGDIAVLMPKRTGLGFLLTELQQRGIPYTDSNTTLLYAEPLVRDLLAVLRAASRPHDVKALFDALTAPALGVALQDLHDFALPFGGLAHAARAAREGRHASVPGALDEPLALISALQSKRSSLDCGELTALAVRRMRLFERAALDGGRDSIWRRLEEVAVEAQSFASEVSPSLHAYLDFVYRSGADSAKVTEADGADLEVDAVRIMTVHAAKGLEFPVVVFTGMNGEIGRAPTGAGLYRGAGGLEVDVRGNLKTEGAVLARDAEAIELWNEAVRLLYVGATRARDHLVVTIPAAPDEAKAASGKGQAALEGGWDGATLRKEFSTGFGLITAFSPLEPEALEIGSAVRRVPLAREVAKLAPPDPEAWLARRIEAIRRATPMPAVTATALMAHLASRRGDAEVAAEYAGGAGEEGLEVGRLVHRLLAELDLSAPDEALERARTRLGRELAPPAVSRRALACLKVALEAPCVRAASNPLREFHASVQLEGGGMLDAVIDLAFETPDGLRIVDYKVVTPGGLARAEERMRTYRVQGGIYHMALSRAAAPLPVAGATFLFVSEEGYREIDCPPADPQELQSLIGEYLSSLRAGTLGGPQRSITEATL